MKTTLILTTFIFLIAFLTSSIEAQQDSLMNHAQHLIDSTRLVDGDVFAPMKFAKAEDKFNDAQLAIQRDKKKSLIIRHLEETIELAEHTLNAAATGKLTLAEYIDPREKAKQAKAPVLAAELYLDAEEQFLKATRKVEDGDVKGGLKEAAKSIPLYDTAELEAIKADIMGQADRLIEKAVEGEAQKFAPSTLDKAKTAREKCDAVLSKDRYERTESIEQITRAEYEARHALQIAISTRSLERNDQAWEKLMLGYEIEMGRVAHAAGGEFLPFDLGAGVAADSLIVYIQNLQMQSASSDELTQQLASKLQRTLDLAGSDYSGENPLTLADRIHSRVSELVDANQSLENRLTEREYQLSELKADHTEVAAQLEARTAKEEKLKKAKQILLPSEGQVLFNAANDIILRLSGLSFDVNKSDIKDGHAPLLEKVKTVLEMFEDAKLVVEGHTDASGEPSVNLALSEKRAYSVMQYLRQSLLISADRILAIGYGSEKPIASNKTTEGRAKNRRIDIIIMQ